MAEEDEDKTSFFAGEGVFCYRKMPFGLNNAGATYQRLVDKVFHDQIGRNLEAYVDDLVIKSTSKEDMLADIKETLESCIDKKNIRWTQEAEAALQEMKKFVEDLPTLTAPIQGDYPLKKAEERTDTKSDNTKLSCEWKLYTNGSASSDGSSVGLMLIDPEGKEYTYALHFGFETTKNEVEYEALLVGL
ncbi:reverse transcriptase domain-containing protein [Tanacetum coccineum]